MKLGVMLANSGPFTSPDLFAVLATEAEKCGFDSIWTVEHVVVPQNYQSPYPYARSGKMPGGEDTPISDPVLPLSFAAAITTKLKLGTGVIILPQRHPFYVAKELATLDVLSKGRALLGVGSGWLKEEFDALGIDFHVRGARTDEAIRAIRVLWQEDSASFHGKHFNFGPVKLFPKPVQKGGVPILVGGHSSAAARRAGRLGDGFFVALPDPEKLTELFAVMKSEAEKAGRNPGTIELSCMGAARLDSLKALQDIGVSRVVVWAPGFDAENLRRGMEKIGNEIIAKL